MLFPIMSVGQIEDSLGDELSDSVGITRGYFEEAVGVRRDAGLHPWYQFHFLHSLFFPEMPCLKHRNIVRSQFIFSSFFRSFTSSS